MESSLTVWFNRPYFDLGPCNESALHVKGIEYSYSNLVKEDTGLQSENITHPITGLFHSRQKEEKLLE
jgi:hypothetical protein